MPQRSQRISGTKISRRVRLLITILLLIVAGLVFGCDTFEEHVEYREAFRRTELERCRMGLYHTLYCTYLEQTEADTL